MCARLTACVWSVLFLLLRRGCDPGEDSRAALFSAVVLLVSIRPGFDASLFCLCCFWLLLPF